MKSLKILFVLSIIIGLTSITALAEAITKQPLDVVFDKAVIIPFDYHNKAFIAGKKVCLQGEYQLVQRNGRVLVPIRLMGQLVSDVPGGKGYWQVHWDPQKPLEVLLSNFALHKNVRLTVNSSIMFINEQAVTLEVAPQKINGRIVLPLRSVAEALNINIEWLNGLIILSHDYIDLQSPQTLAIKDAIKANLLDSREELLYEEAVTPMMRNGNTVYYVRHSNAHGMYQEGLYKKTGSQQEISIKLPGEVRLSNSKILKGELYYPTTINGKSELYIYNFSKNQARKCCDLASFSPLGGWLGDMHLIDDQLYIIVHEGDCTMGSENLYQCVDGQLQTVAHGKNFINYAIDDGYLYYTDFNPMLSPTANLYRVNLKTDEKERLGEMDYTYGVVRTKSDAAVTYSHHKALIIRGDFVYVLGYQETDQNDQPAVYQISLADGTQKKIISAVCDFWVKDDMIYYLENDTKNLKRVDLDGEHAQTLVEKQVIKLVLSNDFIYYTATDSSTRQTLGELYGYNLKTAQETILSDQLVNGFWVNDKSVFYEAEGYDLGLYKVDQNEVRHCITADSINTAIITPAGLVYTLTYEQGVYTAE